MLPIRPLAAVALLALAGGCDVPAPYEHDPTNPYDPAFPGTRLIPAPDSFRLAASGPNTITLAWTDPSSFERGFVVESWGGQTLGVLGPDETEFTIRPEAACEVLSEETPSARVRALGDDDTRSEPTATLRFRLPNVERRDLARLRDGALTPDGATVYGLSRTNRDPWVRAEDVASGAETVFEGYRALVTVLPDGSALLSDGGLGLAVADGGAVVRTVALASPGGPLRIGEAGGAVTDPAGTILAGSWDDGGVLRVAVWDLATGALRTAAAGGLGDVTALGVTDRGHVVVWDRVSLENESIYGPYWVSSVQPATGAVRWRHPLPQTYDRIPVPLLTGDGSGVVVQTEAQTLVLDAANGAIRADFPRPSFAVAIRAEGERLLLLGDGFYQILPADGQGPCEAVRYGRPYDELFETPRLDPRRPLAALRDDAILFLDPGATARGGRALSTLDRTQGWEVFDVIAP